MSIRISQAAPALFATAAIIALPIAASAAALGQDLGVIDAQTQVSATVWLTPHDPAGFTASVSRRMTRGAPDYHRWMNSADVAAAAPSREETDQLVAALKASGLIVSPRGDQGDALRVTGSARAVQAAFNTELHVMQTPSGRHRMATSEPRFAGAGSALIGGITGLSDAPMRPYVLVQSDLLGRKPMQIDPAAPPNPATTFTTACFKYKETVSITHVAQGGSDHVTVHGPAYTATGIDPAKATCGYNPQEIAAQYGINRVHAAGFRGEGQTIVLVDAYGSPTIQTDANTFSSMMGLPPVDAGNFQVIYADGPPISNPYPTGWPLEISLDVEWAHAMAPKAKIVLVVAPSDDPDDLAYALHYAITHELGEVISNSYGYAEADYGPATARAFNTVIAQAAARGIAVNVSTGDSGDFGLGTPVGAASIPADSPFATGVGGTSINLPGDTGAAETAWGTTETFLGDITAIPVPPDFQGFRQGGGGGQSAYFEKPAWQHALPGTGRQLPDISAVADPFTGAIIVTPDYNGVHSLVEVIGGTSLSSPVFSGIWALADQAAGGKLGQAGPIIAALPAGAVRDITPIAATMSNLFGVITAGTQVRHYSSAALLHLTKTQPTGFLGTAVQLTSPTIGIHVLLDLGFGTDSSLMAMPGWDDATGWGVPNGLIFVRAAAAAGK